VSGLIITGTDTGVGKTYVTAAIARALLARGITVRVSKPVATGARLVEGRWLSEDTIALVEAAGGPDVQPYEEVTPWTFAEPAAPPVAARLQGVNLRLTELVEAVRRRKRSGAMVLAEGVGGLLCPLTERETVADWVAALGWPLLIVARRSLGTLNHTLLTLEVAERCGLPVGGLVVNETSPVGSVAEQTNVEELRRRIRVPLLAVVPYRANETNASVPEIAAVDWEKWHADGEFPVR
jgi:dethiobiotin synthetase